LVTIPATCRFYGFGNFDESRDVILRKRYTTNLTPVDDFREVRGRTSFIAFFLGIAIIASSILLGHSHAFYVSFLALSILMALLWRKVPRPWAYLVSISAATPIPIARQQFAGNLLFALWFAVLNPSYLLKLPKWIYLPVVLAILGIATSSINWVSGNFVGSVMRQGAYAFNFFLAPFLLLPAVYLRMSESRDHAANLQGLLFCLIVPSTLLLISAKLFGTLANAWEASLHVGALAEGYYQYQLGKVIVDLTRTGVGFILAALICASVAITVSHVNGLYRVIAGACLASNVFLLLATGSFGSILASLCGLAVIFYTQLRNIKATKVFLSVAALCCMLLLIYSLSPPSTKEYLGKRFEHRVVKADDDRLVLWARAMDYFLEHPEGVGLTYTVGEKEKSNPHNEFIVYAVSYGVMGGLAFPALFIGLLIYFFKRRKNIIGDHNALAIHLAGFSIIVALTVNSMTDNIGVNRWYFNVIWSLIWYSYFCSLAAQTENVPKNIKRKNGLSGTTAYQG